MASRILQKYPADNVYLLWSVTASSVIHLAAYEFLLLRTYTKVFASTTEIFARDCLNCCVQPPSDEDSTALVTKGTLLGLAFLRINDSEVLSSVVLNVMNLL